MIPAQRVVVDTMIPLPAFRWHKTAVKGKVLEQLFESRGGQRYWCEVQTFDETLPTEPVT